MSVLDDLKMIHQRDAQDALGVIAKQSEQLTYKFEADPNSINREKINNIVIGGMGGSALAAGIFQVCPGIKLPLEIVKNYDIPAYVNENSLFIASSYSGNTEETLSALVQAEERNAQIAVIAAGGELEQIAREKNYVHYKIPEGKQPRMAVFYNYAALVQFFKDLGLVESSFVSELEDSAQWLSEMAKNMLPDVAANANPAKQLAQELVGNSVVVYSGPKMLPAAYKWKININENAKNVAWYGTYPEFNHNEFLGWTAQPVDKPYKVVELRSNQENERVTKRFGVSEKLLSGRRPHSHIVNAEGENLLRQLLWTIQLGDFVSIYLALLNNINPTPVELIEKLKQELKD